MSSRKPVYVFGVILLGLLLSAQPVITAVVLATDGISRRQWPLPRVPGIFATTHHNPLQRLPFWRNKFVHFRNYTEKNDGTVERNIVLIEPESGDVEVLDPLLVGSGYFEKYNFGDRIWFAGRNGNFELAENRLQPSDLKMPETWSTERQRFWKGQPAFISRQSNRFRIKVLQDQSHKAIGNLSVPESDREYHFHGILVRLEGQSEIQICPTKEGDHLFVQNAGLLFYHRGLEVVPLPVTVDLNESEPLEVDVESAHADVTTDAASTKDELAGWSVVRESPAVGMEQYTVNILNGIMIEGQPAALIIDDVASGFPIGRLYRMERTTWSEFASMPFPFGSTGFVTVTKDDGQRSYVGVRTSLGATKVYALESTGFRETSGSASVKTFGQERSTWSFESLMPYGMFLASALIVGMILGVLIWLLMRSWTKPEYQFGVQTVKLASLHARGIARLIDLGLIGLTTMALGWLMTHNLDWAAFAEAINLRVDHPTIPVLRRVTIILGVWLAVVTLALLTAQAVWGATPGKWLYRLRTVRTSLRPCGLAASLAREIVFFVDCCNFLCWTPGIVSIALTNRRQRLGDLVADTIVVESKSLTP